MDVIHFTRGATDPLNAHAAQGVRFLPLADGIAGQTWPSDAIFKAP